MRILSYEFINRKDKSCCKVTLIKITQKVIDRVEALSKKDGIILKFKYCKEGIIREDNDEKDNNDGSISRSEK